MTWKSGVNSVTFVGPLNHPLNIEMPLKTHIATGPMHYVAVDILGLLYQ